jgi:hypothetical protein
VATPALPLIRPSSASQLAPSRQSGIAVVEAPGYGAPGATSATLSRLMFPESEAVRVSAIVCRPAVRSRAAPTTFQVSQFAVVGRVSCCAAPPSTVRVSVRASFLPSPPWELAYRRSNW